MGPMPPWIPPGGATGGKKDKNLVCPIERSERGRESQRFKKGLVRLIGGGPGNRKGHDGAMMDLDRGADWRKRYIWLGKALQRSD